MELHHDPPQRHGGLFDVVPYWPAEHAAIDPHRKLGAAGLDLAFRSLLLWLGIMQLEELGNGLTPRVETSYCVQGIDCR